MWEFLPIQTAHLKGQPYTIIQPDFPYPRSPDVRVSEWKDVSPDIQQWALSICEDMFYCARNPISQDDLFAWIPGVGTLIAKRSHWIDTERSFPVVFVYHIYVHPANRKQNVASKLILSVAHEAVQRWNIHAFAFELEDIPASLTHRQAVPFLTFDYVWIPFFPTEEEWRLLSANEMKRHARKQKGFHPSQYTGWQAYEHPQNKTIVLLDSHNDIIYYESFRDILSCHIPKLRGTYVRVFSPLGKCHVFLENLHFQPSVGQHRLV